MLMPDQEILIFASILLLYLQSLTLEYNALILGRVEYQREHLMLCRKQQGDKIWSLCINGPCRPGKASTFVQNSRPVIALIFLPRLFSQSDFK